MTTWGEQLEKCTKNQDPRHAIPLLATLHKERWSLWNEYIDKLVASGYTELYRNLRDCDKDIGKIRAATYEERDIDIGLVEALKEEALKKFKPWDNVLLNKKNKYIFLDASFGSLNYTSDLDINVVSTTEEAMNVWMTFTRGWVNLDSVKKKKVQSFCEYWDSNFYYEPGVFMDNIVLSIPKKLMADGFEWTTKATAMYELQCVHAYTRAYEEEKDIIVDGLRSSPNPVRFTSAKEQLCYSTNLHFAEAFRHAYESYLADDSFGDTVRFAYLKYAVTKIEALVSVTSLAVCEVFGNDVFSDYKLKKGKGKYVTSYIAGIAAYEMLRNLQMHSHRGGYKSKYANRLMKVLTNVDGLCNYHNRSKRYPDITKTNAATMLSISRAITFLLDFMDGKSEYTDGCGFMTQGSWVGNLGETLDALCKKTKEYVEGYIKESTGVRSGKEQEGEGIEYVKNLKIPLQRQPQTGDE